MRRTPGMERQYSRGRCANAFPPHLRFLRRLAVHRTNHSKMWVTRGRPCSSKKSHDPICRLRGS